MKDKCITHKNRSYRSGDSTVYTCYCSLWPNEMPDFLQGLQILSLIPLKKKKPFMALLVTGDLRPQEWNHIEAWSGGYGPHKLLKY